MPDRPDQTPPFRLPSGARIGMFYADGLSPRWVVTLDIPDQPQRVWARRSLQAAMLCRCEIERGETPAGAVDGLTFIPQVQA